AGAVARARWPRPGGASGRVAAAHESGHGEAGAGTPEEEEPGATAGERGEVGRHAVDATCIEPRRQRVHLVARLVGVVPQRSGLVRAPVAQRLKLLADRSQSTGDALGALIGLGP